MYAPTVIGDAPDTLGEPVSVQVETVDGSPLVAIVRAGEVVFDLDPQGAARLGAALLQAAG